MCYKAQMISVYNNNLQIKIYMSMREEILNVRLNVNLEHLSKIICLTNVC